MKTAELTGAALDWAVAKREKFLGVRVSPAWRNRHGGCGAKQIMVSSKKNCSQDFCPSTDWAQGGPIIAQELIRITPVWRSAGYKYPDGVWHWQATSVSSDGRAAFIDGPTPLIAAMRCYVAGKLGDEVETTEVDVPEVLL